MTHQNAISVSPITPGLTPLERDVWVIIDAYTRSTGCSPTYELIARRAGFASKSSAHRVVKDLEARGYVRLEPARQCSIIPVSPANAKQAAIVNAVKREIIDLKRKCAKNQSADALVEMNDKIDDLLYKLSQWEGW